MEGGAGPSRRREEPIIVDQDTSVTPKLRERLVTPTPTNKKGKKKDKKVVISIGGLVSLTSHFESSHIVFPPTPIPYTQTEAFNASFQPLLRYGASLENFSPITYPSVKTGFTPKVTPRKSGVEGGWDLASPYVVRPCLHAQWSRILGLVGGGDKDLSRGVNKPVGVGLSRLSE